MKNYEYLLRLWKNINMSIFCFNWVLLLIIFFLINKIYLNRLFIHMRVHLEVGCWHLTLLEITHLITILYFEHTIKCSFIMPFYLVPIILHVNLDLEPIRGSLWWKRLSIKIKHFIHFWLMIRVNRSIMRPYLAYDSNVTSTRWS